MSLSIGAYLSEHLVLLSQVSHDRGFLNEVCSDIIEFRRRKLTYYRGNFDNYVKQRDENIRNAMRAYQAYQSKREHMVFHLFNLDGTLGSLEGRALTACAIFADGVY